MDSGEQGKPHRGRARGRARSTPDPEVESVVEAEPGGSERNVYAQMFEERKEGSSDGNGNGKGRGGSPMGMSPQLPTTEDAEREKKRNATLLMDYIATRPTHPGFSKKGTTQHKSLPPPTVVANYYMFDTHPEFKMRMYSVKVEPAPEDARIVRRLIATQRERLGSYMATGNMLFATRKISPEMMTFNTNLRNQPDTPYTVKLQYVRDIDDTEATMFQFYNVVVKQMLYTMNFSLIGRHFFNPNASVEYRNWRLELWPGFQNSIRQQDGGLMLNVESVWKVIQNTNVLSIMGTLRHANPNNFREACTRALEGMMVMTKYNPKAYKISRIDFESNPTRTFEYKGEQMTFLEYYGRIRETPIRDPGQPMLVSEPKIRDIRRGQQGDIYLVPELCYPCGLNEELRGNFRLMKEIADSLHMAPTERVSTMQRFIDTANQNDEIVNTLRNWGIRVHSAPVEIKARYLNAEDIVVSGNQVSPDDKADWTMHFRNQRMLTPMRLTTWALIATNRDMQGVNNLIGTLQRVAGPLGYQMQQPQIFRAGDPRSIGNSITEAITTNKGRLDLVFVVLPTNNADGYAAVKRLCSIDYGIPSQCFLSKNLNAKGLMSICTKVVIQMNAKQGGEPWGVVNPLKNAMVLGYDVHHAGPSGGNSVGAMCATVSPSLGRYFSCVRPMPADRAEVATSVAMMFEKCLTAYREKNGHYPPWIFMYRDGVGEGQLKDVFEQEVQAFKDRIKALYQAQQQGAPKMLYIVVNKRINTRFFQKFQNNNTFQNPRPGLIVDDMVTRPERYDFFLISQTARQGCVGPTYYHVLYDDSGLPADRVQMYTYKLCHMYYNWSGTVAVPAPCQNAHKLALQVGTALKRPAHQNLNYLLHFL